MMCAPNDDDDDDDDDDDTEATSAATSVVAGARLYGGARDDTSAHESIAPLRPGETRPVDCRRAPHRGADVASRLNEARIVDSAG